MKYYLLFAFLAFIPFFSVAQDESKMMQQQQQLLSKKEQAALMRSQQQRALLEEREKQLEEQEKAFLRLQVAYKQTELQKEKDDAATRIRNNRILAEHEAALKDEQITHQQEALFNSRKWIFSLVSLSLLIVLIAFIIYRSQRKTTRLNKLIIKQHQELEQVSMVKDRLLTVVGHDMRTPLNMLVSLTNILSFEKIPSDKMAAYIAQLGSTLTHTSTLIDNLLYWAASQMKGYKPVITKVNISNIALEVSGLFQGRATNKEVTLLNHATADRIVFCDPDMMAVVLRNLVSNAIKFTPSGGLVEITCMKENDYSTLSVTDNGTGMSGTNIEKFNSASVQAFDSTPGTDEEKGTGLGLLLCKTFAQMMNTPVSVRKNGEGSGCIFEIRLKDEE